MKIVCVVDLDETLGHFNVNNKFMVRPLAHLLLDFFFFSNIDIILWSYGSDSYVEHIVNSYFDIFLNDQIKTCVFGRSVCEISKRRYGYSKCSKIVRSLYNEQIVLIGIDDQVTINMDCGYDYRVRVEPYSGKNENDEELFTIIKKIIEYGKQMKIHHTN